MFLHFKCLFKENTCTHLTRIGFTWLEESVCDRSSLYTRIWFIERSLVTYLGWWNPSFVQWGPGFICVSIVDVGSETWCNWGVFCFRYLASGSGDTTVRFWDLTTETPHHTARGRKLFSQWCQTQTHCGSKFTLGTWRKFQASIDIYILFLNSHPDKTVTLLYRTKVWLQPVYATSRN